MCKRVTVDHAKTTQIVMDVFSVEICTIRVIRGETKGQR